MFVICVSYESLSDFGHECCLGFKARIIKNVRALILILNGKIKKVRPFESDSFRGSNQIRTGVNGFADRYLTTRTWNH